MVVQEAHVQRQDAPVVVEADAHVLLLGALVGGGHEVLAAVLGVLDLAAQQARGPGDQHLLGPRVHDLHAEAAADVGRHALDLAVGQAQDRRDGEAHARGRLGRGVHAQALVVGVPAGVDAAALQRGGGAALDVQAQLQGARRGGQRRVDVADLLDQVGGDLLGAVQPDDGGEDLVGDPDAVRGVLGEVAVGGDDHHDRLADVADQVLGQRVGGPRRGQGRVGDEQGEGVGEAARQVLVGVDRHQPLHVQGGGDVDVEHAGVRVGAAHERDLQRIVAEVVEVAALPAQQPGVLTALDALAEHARGHRRASPGTPPPGGGA